MSKAFLSNRITAGLLCILLAACGGGGGNTAAPLAAGPAGTDSSGASQPGATQTPQTPQAGPSTPTSSGTQDSAGQTPPAAPAGGTSTSGGGTPPSGSGSDTGTGTGTGTDSGTGGSSSPDATQARFRQPLGIARDGAGNLYVADAGNNTIRKIATSGAVTTLAGSPGASGSSDGVGAAARFSALKGLAVDGTGNLYAVDNSAVRKVTPAGAVTTLAGAATVTGDADGSGAAARFNHPWGIALDAAGNVYVADTGNALVRRIAPDGTVTTFAGTRGMRGRADGSTATATFLGPMGIAADAAGNLFLTDWFGPPAPNIPEGSTFVRRIGADGAVSTMAGNLNSENGPATFMDTFAITADGAGNVYVAAMGSVRRVSATGTVSTVASATAQFASFEGIAIDAAGNLYVTDNANNTVSRVSPAGEIIPIAGKSGEAGAADTP